MLFRHLHKCISVLRAKQKQRRCHTKVQSQSSRETLTKYYGQPTSETHPHLLKAGEILPLITSSELWTRRQKLAQLVRESMKKRHSDIKNHTLIIPSSSTSYMTEKIPYIFRQNSDFLYLSGCQEPDTCLVININEDKDTHESILFLRERDAHSEIWDGPRTDCSEAQQIFGVDKGCPIKEFAQFLEHSRRAGSKSFWYDVSQTHQANVNSIIKEFVASNQIKVCDSPRSLVHKLRVIKSPAEVQLMKKSCEIAAHGIRECMKRSAGGVSEHDLFAIMDYECRMGGAEFLAYPPVIAGGDRATIIHYINNNNVVHDHQMVLMDAGCEYHGYASDITRTWPVNGKFTEAQALLYEVVLDVQKNVIKLLADRFTLDKLFEEMCLLLGRGLQEIGVCQRTSSIATTIKQAYQFCPHHVSHYLGMDVHDTALIPRNITVQPGMTVTVEPGVYIPHTMNVPKEFRGIGIRIEDNVLITDDAPIVLSACCPKNLDVIEQIVNKPSNAK